MEAPKYLPTFATCGCFGAIFNFFGSLFGGGPAKEAPPPQQVPVAPPAPPANSADVPTPDDKKSGELANERADKTGFGALIIPRTAFSPVSRNVPTG